MRTRNFFVPAWTVAILVIAAVLVVPALATQSSGETRRALPAPPHCSAANTRHNAILLVNNPTTHEPLYRRYCGPARAVVSVNGTTYTIRGGLCWPLRSTRLSTPRRRLGAVSIGMFANPPATPVRHVDFWWDPPTATVAHRAFTMAEYDIYVPGRHFATFGGPGAGVVGKRLDGGTFKIENSTGEEVTGSWTCGSIPRPTHRR
jgi:hypothetical protein